MIIETKKLKGIALDWAVALCRKEDIFIHRGDLYIPAGIFDDYDIYYSPSMVWSQGGSIIDDEQITVIYNYNHWCATTGDHHADVDSYHRDDNYSNCYKISESDVICGPTALIAAMRCYVRSKMGDSVDIPFDVLPLTK